MSKTKLRVSNTDLDNLVSNLRGEVGEVITTWVLLRRFHNTAQVIERKHKDGSDNPDARFVHLMADKMQDELVGRLSELAENKIGQLTFHFAAVKLGKFSTDTTEFTKWIIKTKIREKRNRDISHKQLPEKWTDHRPLNVQYRHIVRAVALALRLMKRIDRHLLGPAAPFVWREARKRRYDFMSPPAAGYMLIPYLNLSPEERALIVMQELAEGKKSLSKFPTIIDGKPGHILACKQWGVILAGDRLLGLARYPLVSLENITTE